MLSGPAYIPQTIQQALVLLHGYGANGDDLFSLAQELNPAVEGLAVFAPNAPHSLMENTYEWFSLDDFFSADRLDLAYLSTLTQRAIPAAQSVQEYIRVIQKKHNLAASQITLAGFSQGGLVAAIATLTVETPLKGLILMSAVPLITQQINICQKPPVLMTHGAQDPVVPFQAATLSRQNLTSSGLTVSEYTSPYLGHGIDAGCIEAIIRFLKETK